MAPTAVDARGGRPRTAPGLNRIWLGKRGVGAVDRRIGAPHDEAPNISHANGFLP